MGRWRIWLAYDGRAFQGWERQAGPEPTVRGSLEAALAPLAGTATPVRPAGRTDAGVHAAGQVASFELERETTPGELVRALNARLPEAVRVYGAQAVGADFHVQRQVREKLYVYAIWVGGVPPPFLRGRVWAPGRRPDAGAMRAAATGLVGRHDFRAYQAAGRPVASTVRTLERVEVEERGPVLLVRVGGAGFLYRMVRRIVGALVAVGWGRARPEEPAEALVTGWSAAATAPAEGLCLAEVRYALPDPPAVEEARRGQLAAWCPWAADRPPAGALTPFPGEG
ncbi:MAG: tRNA pseudouridine(38-40) synthase TruA [Bacillota bacterium]|nr:tRNA pseudouridine(38-40) synthase TruA [Bacillota bacterium]